MHGAWPGISAIVLGTTNCRSVALMMFLVGIGFVSPLKAAEQRKVAHYKGTVVLIKQDSFVLGSRNRVERKLFVSQATRFYNGQHPGTFSEILVGDSASVTVLIRVGKLWAEHVHFLRRVPRPRTLLSSATEEALASFSQVVQSLRSRISQRTDFFSAQLSLVDPKLDNSQVLPTSIDCSHFVHETYVRAGLEYAYANSGELYRGVEPFASTLAPTVGDLIVWAGHVGIVVDPERGTFLSVLRRGLRVSHWRSKYWRRHGKSVFYQYVPLEEMDISAPIDSPHVSLESGSVSSFGDQN